MKLNDGQITQTPYQKLGRAWINAIAIGELDRLEGFCHPDISSRLLLPRETVTLKDATGLVERYTDWFAGSVNLQLEESRVHEVGERLGIFYRFHLQRQDKGYVIEQQLYGGLKQDRFDKLWLVCSGFQPLEDRQEPVADALLEFHSAGPEAGATCAVLTPMILSRMRELQTGQVLEVIVDDVSARGDIESWSRLSGNPVLKVVECSIPELRFFIKKK